MAAQTGLILKNRCSGRLRSLLPASGNEQDFSEKPTDHFCRMSTRPRQCKAGNIEQEKYETGMQLKKAGVIGVKDMTIETVIVKSMLLIKKYPLDKDKFKKFLLSNIAGEITE